MTRLDTTTGLSCTLSGRFAATLGAQEAERLGIARDLNDTLLQGFQGHVVELTVPAQRACATVADAKIGDSAGERIAEIPDNIDT